MRLTVPLRTKASLAGMLVVGSAALALTYPTDLTISRMFESEGDYESAITYLERWTRKYPRDYGARWHAAELMTMTVQPQRAIAALSEMRTEWPDDVRIVRRIAHIEESLLRVDEALPSLEAMAALSPDDPALIRQLADVNRWFGRQEALLENLLQLVSLGSYPEEQEELVDTLLAQERYRELIDVLTAQPPEVQATRPSLEALHEAYRRSGRKEAALAILWKLLEREPRQVEDVLMAGELLEELHREDEAIAFYEEHLQRWPHQRMLRRELRDLFATRREQLLAEGESERAIALLRREIALDPTNLSLRLELGYLHGEERSTEVAIRELRNLSQLVPRSVQVWRELGIRLGWLERHHEAVEALERAHELAPDDLELHRELANHALWAEELDLALAYFKSLVAAGGTQEDVLTLWEVATYVDDAQTALEAALELVRVAPQSLKHQKLLASAALEAERCDLAVEPLRRVTRSVPNDVVAWAELAKCAQTLGLKEDIARAIRAIHQSTMAEASQRGGSE